MNDKNMDVTFKTYESQSDFYTSSSTKSPWGPLGPNFQKILDELRRLFQSTAGPDLLFLDWANGKIKIDSWEDFVKEVNKRANQAIPGSGNVGDGSPLHMAFMNFMLSDLFGITVPEGSSGTPGWDTPMKGHEKIFGPWNPFLDMINERDPDISPMDYYNKMFKALFAEFAKEPMVFRADGGAMENIFINFGIFIKFGSPPSITHKDANMETYRKEYFSRFPNTTEEDFQVALKKFYNKAMTEQGYFHPTLSMDQWISDLEALQPITDVVERWGFKILYELLDNLSQMVGVLQEVAIAQATLTKEFYTPMLKAYTDLITSIPAGTMDMVARYFTKKEDQVQASQAIANFNAALGDKLRTFNTLLKDEVGLQSTSTEQTQQAIQQQTSMYELPLSTLLSILRAIQRR